MIYVCKVSFILFVFINDIWPITQKPYLCKDNYSLDYLLYFTIIFLHFVFTTTSMILKNLVLFWKSIAITILILYLSLARPVDINEMNVLQLTDKLGHYLVYVVFGLILVYDFARNIQNKLAGLQFWLICIIYPIVLGGIIEIVQETFFKPRSAEWLDWACDFLGIGTAYVLMRLIQNKTRYF